MYWTAYLISLIVILLVALSLPFIKKVREFIARDLDDSPFFIFDIIEEYLDDKISFVFIVLSYGLYLIMVVIISIVLAIFWPALAFLIIIYFPIKFILKKQKR